MNESSDPLTASKTTENLAGIKVEGSLTAEMSAVLANQARRNVLERLRSDPGLPVDNPTMSFWQDPEHAFAHRQSTVLPRDTDIVIIGSGITAVSTAQHLLRLDPNLDVVILEARAAISGATGRNGGHIKASPWGDYSSLKQLFGKESGMKIMKFRMAHLDAFCQEASHLGEAGKSGLVRRTQSLSVSYDLNAWERSKESLREFLCDFPEERSKWSAIDNPAELKVCQGRFREHANDLAEVRTIPNCVRLYQRT